MKILKTVILILICIVIFSSCNFNNSTNNFKGGELLNNELISQIKEEILSGSREVTVNETEDKAESKTEIELNTESETEIELNSENEINSAEQNKQTEKNDDSKSPAELSSSDVTESETNEQTALVYWLEGGSVWHLYRDCRHIKNSKKEIISGSIADAIVSGAETVCKTCAKKSD